MSRKAVYVAVCLLTPVVLSSFVRGAEWSPPATDDSFFQEYVLPLLETRCLECHSHAAGEASGGLVLDSQSGWKVGGDSGPAIVPGELDASLLWRAVGYADESLQMPPDGKLSEKELGILEKWIRTGAADPRLGGTAASRAKIDIEQGRRFWAFQPLVEVPLPEVQDTTWASNAIDRFVQRRLEDAGLSPKDDAPAEVLLRRLFYDLAGLPPSAKQMAAFLGEWNQAAAEGPSCEQRRELLLARTVDGLLASPQFGEKWGRHWLDLARYADSNGSSFNPPFPQAWRYRNWVIQSLNDDMPMDLFIVKQLAGDLLPWDSQAERDGNLTATGYLMLGSKVLGTFDKEQLLLDVVDEQLDVIGKSLLGMTIACARCHDHKFDPIPQRDYYALAGILESTITLEDRLGGPKEDESDWSRRGLGPEGDLRLEQFLAEHRYAWIKATQKAFQARRKLEQLDNPVDADGSKAPSDAEEAVRARQEWETACQNLAALQAQMPPHVMAPRDIRQPADTHVRIRGVPSSRGEQVPRGYLQVAEFAGQVPPNDQASGRLELARWIADSRNPLTARVLVNRVWKHLFREGLVRSVDNFGATGEEPSHPELLDYLARKLIDQQWRLKPLIRCLVLSRTYRLSTAADPTSLAADPENRLLWRQHRRRLEPEEIRDSLLCAGGRLDLSGGEGMIGHLPIGDISNLGEYLRISDCRRTVYQPVFRTLEPDVLQLFDAANSAMTTGARPRTTVAPQSLYFLNSPFVQQCAKDVATRLTAECHERHVSPLVRRAFEEITCREPTESEQRILERYLEAQFEGPEGPTDHDVFKLCQAIFGSTQFQFLD